jgi:putative solute:sodium symporter small subunit
MSSPKSLSQSDDLHRRYWKYNLRLMIVLLAVWALTGLGCGILWADVLNQWNLPGTGYPLGFWFAHQGSILVFVALILIYALAMDRLDRTLRADVLAQTEGTGHR